MCCKRLFIQGRGKNKDELYNQFVLFFFTHSALRLRSSIPTKGRPFDNWKVFSLLKTGTMELWDRTAWLWDIKITLYHELGSEWVSGASERANERTSERTSEWPRTYVPILGFSNPSCIARLTRSLIHSFTPELVGKYHCRCAKIRLLWAIVRQFSHYSVLP